MIEAVAAIAVVLFIALLILLSTYNGLMQQRQDVRAAWTKMDDAFKQRYALIPALTSAVQTIGGEAVLKLPAVIAAKNQAAVAFNPQQLAEAEAALTKAIAEVLIITAGHPAIAELQQKVTACQKQVDQARRHYNDQVEVLNSSLGSFPQIVTAKIVGMHEQPSL